MIPTDAIEIRVVRRGGEILRWQGPAAQMVAQAVALVTRLTSEIADMEMPEPEVSAPIRTVEAFDGRLCVAGDGRAWLYREKPGVNLDLASLMPEVLAVRTTAREDAWGNRVRGQSGRARIRIEVEVQTLSEEE